MGRGKAMDRTTIGKLFATTLLTALALLPLSGWAEPVARKFIGTGWDTLRISPEEVLANAPAFADSGLDGISLCFSTRDAAGNKLAYDTVMSRTAFTYGALEKYVPTFRKIAACPGLKESLLTVWWTPKKEERLGWADDAAWRTFAGNMAVMARLAKEGGLKGLFLDWEDYGQSGQFRCTEADPEAAETLRLARRRGHEIGKAVFDAFPDVVFFSYWWLSHSSPASLLQASERAYAIPKSLWPAFVNGLLDVMPDGARLVDGREHYHLESSRRDFYGHASAVQTACQALVAPENRAKYRRAVSVSFGHYIDMYVNDESVARWYFGPEGGSRLEHFRRNVEQAARAATEYVWIYGEKGLFVPLTGCSSGWVAKQKTWEELLPGWQEAVKGVKRATALAEATETKPPSAAASSGPTPKLAAAPAPGAKPPYDAQGDLPKKFIATGGCVEGLAPKDLLAKADDFAALGLDGVALPILAAATTINRAEANCPTRARLVAGSFRPHLADLRKMAAKEGLKESLLYVDWSPSKLGRLPWGDAPRWNVFAQNMGLLARLARASGLKGLFKANAGKARDLVPDPACAKGIGNGYFAYIDRKIAPGAVIDTDTAVGEGDSASFRMKGCKDGTLMFRVQGVKPGDAYIVQFSTKGYPVFAKAAWRESGQFRWNVPSVDLPVAAENAAGWREASRIVRAPDMAGYNEMYLMVDTRGAADDDVAWVDNVHVYRLSRRD